MSQRTLTDLAPGQSQKVWMYEHGNEYALAEMVNTKLDEIEQSGGVVLDVQYRVGTASYAEGIDVLETRHSVMVRYRGGSA